MPYFYPLLLYSFWVLSSIFPFDLRVTRVPFCCNDRKRSQNGFCCLSPPTSFLFLRSPLLCGKLSRGWQLHQKHQILIRQFFPHRLEDVYHDVDFTSFSWYYLKIDNPLQNLQRFGSSKRNLKRLGEKNFQNLEKIWDSDRNFKLLYTWPIFFWMIEQWKTEVWKLEEVFGLPLYLIL